MTDFFDNNRYSHDPRAQILLANVDQLFVFGSLAKPTFSSNRADRILAACAYFEIPAALILNKIDLDKDNHLRDISRTFAPSFFPMSM